MDVDENDPPSKETDLQSVLVKEEVYDIKSGNLSLSVTTKVEANPEEVTKMKRKRILFSHLPSVKEEAVSSFTQIKESLYQYEDLGESQQQDVMACECKPLKTGLSGGLSLSVDDGNMACGDNDCINFATSMECMDDECSCGVGCRNQRFQRCEYADIDVIETERKGFGIRANTYIPAHTFVYEYVGEVIADDAFRKRTHDYGEEGIKHFYFMMIQQGEYIDATKKGGLGRFMNHSCAPNCYVDKWVVGTKLRMGIFTDRNVQAGEELTFDYNVDRYGYVFCVVDFSAEAQPCYCGEPNCIGYIGGKTQTEAQPKLSHAVKEGMSLGLHVDDSAWIRQ
jgi:[histone H3]-lysine36 N-trimethyltransferase